MTDLARILEVLDRDGALTLDADIPVERATAVEDYDVYEVDWDTLFPAGRADQDGQDFDLFGDGWELPPDVLQRLAELFHLDTLVPVEASSDSAPAVPLPWDVWAWYQPIHFHGPDWGIYITEQGLLECATLLMPYCLKGRNPTEGFFKAMLRAAFSVLFLHEQYHHKVESAAIRMHLVQQRAVYPAYWQGVYLPALGTANLLEEGLAGADSFFRLSEPWHRKWVGASSLSGVRSYLRESFRVSPPGYDRAAQLLDRESFKNEEALLLAALAEQKLPPLRRDPTDLRIATGLTKSLFNIRQAVCILVPRGATPIIPAKRPVQPLKRSKLEKFVRAQGYDLLKGGKGSHAKYKSATGKMLIIPHRDDVSMRVLQTTAQTLGMTIRELREAV